MPNKRIDFSFSKQSLMYLIFSKKKCRNCGNGKMKRAVRQDFVGEGKGIRPTHFGEKPDAYKGTIFYICPKCESIYLLEDLVSSKPKKSNKSDLISKSTIKTSRKQEKKEKRKGTKLFFDIVGVAMVMMVAYGAIVDKEVLVALIFIPIILLFWLVSRYMLKL